MSKIKKMDQNDSSNTEGLLGQRDYTRRLVKEGCEFTLMIADAFVRGIREIGYKSNATALNELVDNALQAAAQNVHVAFGYKGESEKPVALAILDDGHGMDKEMIRAAVMWGGTHRENDRAGFGRFGYGLPSASVSIGKRFTVYSWHAESGGIHAVSLDVDEISAGAYRNERGAVIVPPPSPAELPEWVTEYFKERFPGGMPRSGTAVVIDKMDRLHWKTTKALQEKLLEQFGVVYRNFLRTVAIAVHGRIVEAVDPLFLTPGARVYDSDAVGLPPGDFEVKDRDSGKPMGIVKVRYAFLPPTRFSVKYSDPSRAETTKKRNSILAEYNGIIVLRNGRQVDVVTRLPRTWRHTFQNNDRFFKVEIDFPPTLDEDFSVTTSKQQVSLSDRVWDLLEKQGVRQMIRELGKRVDKELKEAAAADTEADQRRASEQAMEEAARFKTRKPGGETPERAEKARAAMKEHAKRQAAATGVPAEVIEVQLQADQVNRPYKVEREDLPGAPFYRVQRRGGQIVLLINEGHRFYSDVYVAFEATPRLRAALEVLLFVMGECELDATDDRQQFYETERAEWSRILNTALDRLGHIRPDETRHAEPETEDDGQEAA